MAATRTANGCVYYVEPAGSHHETEPTVVFYGTDYQDIVITIADLESMVAKLRTETGD